MCYRLTIWFCLQGKNAVTGNSFFFDIVEEKRKVEKKVNVGTCITQPWSVHSSKLTGSIMIITQVGIFSFSFVRMNQCSSFCLCVLCNLKNEFFY